MQLRYERATKTIRTIPNNNWVCSVDSWDKAIDPEAIAIAMVKAFNQAQHITECNDCLTVHCTKVPRN